MKASLLFSKGVTKAHVTGFSGDSRIYIGLAWFTTASPGIGKTGIIIWDNGLFNGYNSFIGFNPNKQRGVVILCSTIQRNLLVSQIGFGPYDDLSNLIWNLLNH
jgi:hypothetical protein